MLILTAWETAYRLVGWRAYVFPAPSHLLDATLGLLNIDTGFSEPLHHGWPKPTGILPSTHEPLVRRVLTSPLVTADLVSFTRLLVGFALSIVLGLILGVAMWRWLELDRFLGPLFLGMQTLPSVCWVPLAILIFGLSEKGILFVLVMGSFFAIAIALRDGLRQIPPLYERAGNMLGARGWRLYRYVMLPASLPALSSSLRQGFSFAWRSLMGAELIFFVGRNGLGNLLSNSRETLDVAQVVAIMAIMVIIGMVVDRLAFARFERVVYHRFGLSAGR